jgi:hypothetical protein
MKRYMRENFAAVKVKNVSPVPRKELVFCRITGRRHFIRLIFSPVPVSAITDIIRMDLIFGSGKRLKPDDESGRQNSGMPL